MIKLILDSLRKTYHYGRYRKVKKLIENNGKLLDIGCGKPCEFMEDGSFLNYIKFGIGMDIKNCSIKQTFIKGNVVDIPFSKKTFDIVVAMEVIEHLEDIEIALKNINYALKDDGVIILTTPSNNLIWKIFWSFWPETIGKMWKEKHKNEFTEIQWRNLLNKYFSIKEVKQHWFINLIFKMKKR